MVFGLMGRNIGTGAGHGLDAGQELPKRCVSLSVVPGAEWCANETPYASLRSPFLPLTVSLLRIRSSCVAKTRLAREIAQTHFADFGGDKRPLRAAAP